MINIIHIHINDMSEDVTFDVAYMGDGETLKLYSDFDKDAAGRVLRYRILIKDQAIFRLLYNQG
jgi:hypothetical protein